MKILKHINVCLLLLYLGFALILFLSKPLTDLACAAEVMDLFYVEATEPHEKSKASPVKANKAEKVIQVPGILKEDKNNYKIGIGDVLEIVTWKEPDFSRDNILVRLDGKISLPLLDDFSVVGQSPQKLKLFIETQLQRYVDSPNVMVSVKISASQRFYILGEVVRVGEYPLQKELTIIQAFSVAGGFTEWATKKEIILIRKKNDGGSDVIKVDYKKLSHGDGLENNLVIKADDTLIVP